MLYWRSSRLLKCSSGEARGSAFGTMVESASLASDVGHEAHLVTGHTSVYPAQDRNRRFANFNLPVEANKEVAAGNYIHEQRYALRVAYNVTTRAHINRKERASL